MKRGLSYIVMAVFCGLCFSSCAKDELAAKAGGDGRAPVRLALSLSGNSSRTVDAPTADGNWDFTTPEQGTIVEGDVYVLVIDAVTQRLKYLVEDLRVINDYADQKILEGTMQRTIGNEQVRLVVLANLNQNQIQGVSEGMQAYLNTMVGNTAVEIYNKLVYNYTGPTPWNLAERRLPRLDHQSGASASFFSRLKHKFDLSTKFMSVLMQKSGSPKKNCHMCVMAACMADSRCSACIWKSTFLLYRKRIHVGS